MPLFFVMCSLSLVATSRSFYSLSTFEVYLYAISLAYVLNTHTKAFHVVYCNITSSIDGIGLSIFLVADR